jgi:hypothetical protein
MEEVNMTSDYPKCRADLFALAKKLRRKQETLYTLGNVNDPWMADVDYRSKAAHWVADIFQRFDIRSRVHVRRVHYRLVSQEQPILQVDGTPYVNSFDCFNRLCDAIRDARYLDLICTDVIVDRRNPEPIINYRVTARRLPKSKSITAALTATISAPRMPHPMSICRMPCLLKSQPSGSLIISKSGSKNPR